MLFVLCCLFYVVLFCVVLFGAVSFVSCFAVLFVLCRVVFLKSREDNHSVFIVPETVIHMLAIRLVIET